MLDAAWGTDSNPCDKLVPLESGPSDVRRDELLGVLSEIEGNDELEEEEELLEELESVGMLVEGDAERTGDEEVLKTVSAWSIEMGGFHKADARR